MGEWITQWLVGDGARGTTSLEFGFSMGIGVWPGLLLMMLAAALVWRFYPRHLVGMSPGRSRLVTLLRIFSVITLLFLLLGPALVGYRFDPKRNFLLLLFDDSASMSIAPHGGRERGERLAEAYNAALKDFEEPLADRYQLARYAVGEGARRIRDLGDLTYRQHESRLQDAVETALQDFQGINVSGVVLFSDGVEQPLTDLKLNVDVPVMTVSVDGDGGFSDLEIERVNFSRAGGEGVPIRVNVSFHATGLTGYGAIVDILQNDKVVTTSTVPVETDDETQEVRLTFEPRGRGWLEYEVRLRPGRNGTGITGQDDVPQNNSRPILIDNRRRNFRMFYFSGRPNWENKYVQMALENDEEVDLTSVLRISSAETKFVYRGKNSSLVNPLFEGFYRDDMDQPRYDESVFLRFGGDPGMAGKGFPETIDELFGYQILVLGEIEANFFSQEQLELVRDFVQKRGGALLLLGGPHSFSEGNYQSTVLSGILPVVLAKTGDLTSDAATARYGVRPTLEGSLTGTFMLHPSPDKNRELWEELPKLGGLNQFPMVRPHATTLARAGTSENNDVDGSPLFAQQRYGEGKTAILATGATWQWHMGTESQDSRHRSFWRQMVRGLGHDVAGPILLRNKKDSYVSGEEVSLSFVVRDKYYEERSGARTRLNLIHPDGQVSSPPVEEDVTQIGVYTVSFVPEQEGVYRFNLSTADELAELAPYEDALLVTDDRREYQRARPNPEWLARMAEANGGTSYTLDQLGQIPDQIPYVKHDENERIILPFWHWPPFFVMLVAAMSLEWYLRRKRGFA